MVGLVACYLAGLTAGGAIAPPASPTTLQEIAARIERETGESVSVPPSFAGRMLFAAWAPQSIDKLVPGLAFSLGLGLRREPDKKRWILTAPPIDPVLVSEWRNERLGVSQFLSGVKDFLFVDEKSVVDEYDHIRLIYNTLDKSDAQSPRGLAYRLQVRALGALQNRRERSAIGLLSWLPVEYLSGKLGTRLDESAAKWFSYRDLPTSLRGFIPAELRPGGERTYSAEPYYCVNPVQRSREYVSWAIHCVLPQSNSQAIGQVILYDPIPSPLSKPLDIKGLQVPATVLKNPDSLKDATAIDQRDLPRLIEGQGASYAAWCRPFSLTWPAPPNDLTYRWLCQNARLSIFGSEERPGVHVLFQTQDSWVRLYDRIPYVPSCKVDWTKHLAILRRATLREATLRDLQEHFIDLPTAEIANLSGAEYEQGSLTSTERALSVGSGLLKATFLYLALNRLGALPAKLEIPLAKQPPNVRDPVLAYLRYSKSQSHNKESWRPDFSLDKAEAKIVVTSQNNTLKLFLQVRGADEEAFSVSLPSPSLS